MKGLDARRHEIVAKHQILGRIPVDRQLRQEQHFGTLSFGPTHGAGNASLVARYVADTEIQLSPGDSKWHASTIRPGIRCRA
jgi:hypothetical protein